MYYTWINGVLTPVWGNPIPVKHDLGETITKDELVLSSQDLIDLLGFDPTQVVLTSVLALKAPLASPTFTGVPAAPTANLGTNSTQLATTGFVKAAIDALIAGAPGALDTLKEISDQLSSDESAVSALTTSVAGKVPSTRTVAGHALSSDVTLTKGDVGLGNVDNTSDTNKPVSTAQQTALDLKANSADIIQNSIVTPSSPTTGQTVSASTNKLDETLYITPAGTLLALTIALPTSANSRAGQVIRGFISQIITGLTVNVSGSGSVIGSLPITSAVNSSFAYQCVSVSGNGTWIRLY